MAEGLCALWPSGPLCFPPPALVPGGLPSCSPSEHLSPALALGYDITLATPLGLCSSFLLPPLHLLPLLSLTRTALLRHAPPAPAKAREGPASTPTSWRFFRGSSHPSRGSSGQIPVFVGWKGPSYLYRKCITRGKHPITVSFTSLL